MTKVAGQQSLVDLRIRHRTAPAREKQLEKLKRLGREMDRGARSRESARVGVEDELTE